MNLKKPVKNWRYGQTIFNFLEWLKIEKNMSNNQSERMADTFHMSDEMFRDYWKEYLSKFDEK